MRNRDFSTYEDDLTGVTDINERRKVQNRVSQRKRRANIRTLENTLKAAGSNKGLPKTLKPAPQLPTQSKVSLNSILWEEESSVSPNQYSSNNDNPFDMTYGHDVTMSLDGLMPFLDSRTPGPWTYAGILPEQQSSGVNSWPGIMPQSPESCNPLATDCSTPATHSSVSTHNLQLSNAILHISNNPDLQLMEDVQTIEGHAARTKADSNAAIRPRNKRRSTTDQGSYANVKRTEIGNLSADSSRILNKIQKLVDEIEDIYTLGLKIDMIEKDADLLALIRSIPHRIHMKSDPTSDDRVSTDDEEAFPSDEQYEILR